MEKSEKKKSIFSNEFFFELTKELVEKSLIDRRRIVEKHILKGNPEVGTIDFIRQLHKAKDIDENTEKVVSLCQLEILKVLRKKEYKSVFCESLPADEGKILEITDHFKEKVTNEFNQFDATKPTDEQLKMLYDYGAPLIYSVLNNDVKLFGTINDLIHKQAHSVKIFDKHYDRHVKFVRERNTAKIVRKYIDENPGKKIALVYGAAHNFRFDFLRDLPLSGFLKQFGQRKKGDYPVLNEISFPQSYNLAYLSTRHRNFLSPTFLIRAMATNLGIVNLLGEYDRFMARQRKRDTREQIEVERLVEQGEKYYEIIKKINEFKVDALKS